MLRIRASEKQSLEEAEREAFVQQIYAILRDTWVSEVATRGEDNVKGLLRSWMPILINARISTSDYETVRNAVTELQYRVVKQWYLGKFKDTTSAAGGCEAQQTATKRFAIQADEPDARGKYLTGFIDETGRIVIAPAFDAAKPFSEGLAAVKIDHKWGFIDEAGKLLIAPAWEEVGSFTSGRASVLLERRAIASDPREGLETTEYTPVVRCAFVDCAGAMRIGPAWTKLPVGGIECPSFRDGRAGWVAYDEKLGPGSSQSHVFDASGAPVSGGVAGYRDGFALVQPDPKLPRMKPVDATGKALALPTGWLPIAPFSEGLACVAKTAEVDAARISQTGFIDTTGKLVFAVTGQAEDFQEGRAVVGEPGKGPFSYIDASGKVLTRGLREAESFSDGCAFAILANGETVILDKQAQVIRKREKETRVPGGLFHVYFYTRAISGGGPPPVMGYKNLAGKYVYLSQGIVEQKGEAWVREHYAGPANQSPLKKP